MLRVGGDGRIHILGRISRPELVYLTCAASCAAAESWQRLALADYNQQAISDQIPMAVYPANLDLEIDRAGGVVVGFGGPTPGKDEWIDQWGTKKRGRTSDLWVFTARARWTIVQ